MKAIMVMFDSLNRHMLPPYGCEWVKAPNFERAAAKTVVTIATTNRIRTNCGLSTILSFFPRLCGFRTTNDEGERCCENPFSHPSSVRILSVSSNKDRERILGPAAQSQQFVD